jgi:hypothetical protein
MLRSFRPAQALALGFTMTAARAAGLVPLDAGGSSVPPAPWHVAGLPLQTKPFSRFTIVDLGGQRVLRLQADNSYGNLVHRLGPGETGRYLSWRWRLDLPNPLSDRRRRDGDDNAVEICVAFELPLAAVPFVERQLIQFARSQSRELLPTASVCYVWDPNRPTGTMLDSAFTRRIRLIVLRGAGEPLVAWRSERRDVHADFLALFGDEAQEVPPVVGVGIAADADNTHGRSLAHVADIALQP